MFSVRWTRTALDELANLWIRADAAMRQAITAATNQIDQGLRSDPNTKGESRKDRDRVWFVFPLGVLFEVNRQQAVVRILHVWTYQRRTN